MKERSSKTEFHAHGHVHVRHREDVIAEVVTLTDYVAYNMIHEGYKIITFDAAICLLVWPSPIASHPV